MKTLTIEAEDDGLGIDTFPLYTVHSIEVRQNAPEIVISMESGVDITSRHIEEQEKTFVLRLSRYEAIDLAEKIREAT